jgi:hypothetical protein
MICIFTIITIASVPLLQHGQTLGIRSMVLTATLKVEVRSCPSRLLSNLTSSLVGLFDATILLAGIVAALVGAPLIGRMFGRNLQWAVRTFLPIISACWIAQIWNVKPHNDGSIFAVMAIIGICSFLLLPVGLELGAEVTRNAEASCGLLWFKFVV